MAERDAAVVRQAVEIIWNEGELTLADRLFAPAYVNHGGLITDVVHGPEAIKISVALYRVAFPELSITIERMVTEGDIVELGWTAYGSARDLPGSSGHCDASGALSGMTRSRLRDGQIVESWTSWDREGVLRRLTLSAETGSRPGTTVSSDRPDG